MSFPLRAALAAASLFVLSGCATLGTPPFTPDPSASAETTAATELTPEAIRDALTSETAEVAAPETSTASPAANETLLYGAQTKWELQRFVEAVRGASLQTALEGAAPMTVFAPNNQAFEYARLGGSEDIGTLLKGHMIAGAVDMAALKARAGEAGSAKLTTQAGTELSLFVRDDVIKIAGPNGVLATVTQGDMIQSNGVMHQISSVLEAE